MVCTVQNCFCHTSYAFPNHIRIVLSCLLHGFTPLKLHCYLLLLPIHIPHFWICILLNSSYLVFIVIVTFHCLHCYSYYFYIYFWSSLVGVSFRTWLTYSVDCLSLHLYHSILKINTVPYVCLTLNLSMNCI